MGAGLSWHIKPSTMGNQVDNPLTKTIQEGLALASIAQDDPSTLRGDDPFPRTRMHRDRNTR